MAVLDDLDPFSIHDAEAERLDRYFGGLDDDGWHGPTRCAGWSVRDVLAHLAGQEAYNHACLDDDLESLWALLERENVSGLDAFNDWTVRTRRDRPVAEVLEEWRGKSGETRRRMRALGRDGTLTTMAGRYPAGLQSFHYASEYATHADDIDVPGGDAPERMAWRARFALFALAERDAQVDIERDDDGDFVVRIPWAMGRLSPAEFVQATVGRLPDDHPLDRRLRDALRCLA